MGTPQTLITMGALIILSLASLSFNSSFLETTTIDFENKVYLTAFSLADDMIEEIKVKAYDEATLKFPTTTTTNLTLSENLGPDLNENSSSFDDIDDYNNYSKLISAPHAEDYQITCNVFYVDGDNPDDLSLVQTFYKKVKVTVASPYLRNDVSLSFIFTLK